MRKRWTNESSILMSPFRSTAATRQRQPSLTIISKIALGRFFTRNSRKIFAGKDGEKVFNDVFGSAARCVVVFYRPEWGQTPFTRIEETAIRNRAFQEGYEFSLFIPTGDPQGAPPWLPKTRLWYGLSRFGLKGAAAVIEQRVQELGGSPTVETVAEGTARLQRQMGLADAKKKFRESQEGANAGFAAFRTLVDCVEASCKSLASTNSHLARMQLRKFPSYGPNFFAVSGLGLWMTVRWTSYANVLGDSVLEMEFWDSVPGLPGYTTFHEPHRTRVLKFDYELFEPGTHGYVARQDRDRRYSPDELADYLLRTYLDAAETYKPPRDF